MQRTIGAMLLSLLTGLAAASDPTLELIMADPDWMGNAPESPWWSDDGRHVYYRRKKTGENYRQVFRVGVLGGEPGAVAPAAVNAQSGRDAVYNRRRTRSAWIEADDVYLKDLGSGRVTQVTNTVVAESALLFLADGERLGFKRDGVYYLFELNGATTRQVSDIHYTDDPHNPPGFDSLREQQRAHYSAMMEDKRRKLAAETAMRRGRDAGREVPLQPLYLGKRWQEIDRLLSPDGRHLLLVVKDKQWEKQRRHRHDQMPNYVTEAGTVQHREVRERVGRAVPPNAIYVMVDLASGEIQELDTSALPGRGKDPLAQQRREAIKWHLARGAEREAVNKVLEAPAQRNIVHQQAQWSPHGEWVAIMVVAEDNKDRWLFTAAAGSAVISPQHRVSDAAWVNWDYREFGWLPEARALWYQSEESGYNHLYIKPLDKRRARALTSGKFVTREPAFSPDGKRAWLVANRSHPGEWEVYSVAASGGDLMQHTRLGGVSSFNLSPDASQLLISHSGIDYHADLYTMPSQAVGVAPRRITHTESEAFAAIDWVIPAIVEVPSSHTDRPVYSKLYLPPDHNPAQTYPAVMFVHGAGYTQNAHKGWPYYFREFMFHTVLANAGYVILDMDYRASQGYGRDWRTAIYRNMGHPELEDYLDGIEYLVAEQGVARERVGIYGGSYGGFMTFMALFRAPQAFAAGAALRPVVDFMHYNHEYTSAILNTPAIDPWAYQASSPINHVAGLERPLLIAVGMQDDNVFFQDSVLLVQRLIELKKQDWNIAIYPLDGHGFHIPASWLDEYRRIFKLMEDNLK